MADPDLQDDDPSEQVLVDATQHGDRVALDTLLARHLPAVRAFVRIHLDPGLRARESESDVVQSVCVGLLQNLTGFEFRGDGPFRRWLYVAALNKIREKAGFWHAARRDVRREARGEDAEQHDWMLLHAYRTVCTPSQHAAAREQLGRVETALDRLPEHYREVIVLARIVGLSQDELAEVMGRSRASARNLLSRALVRLSAELDALGAT